jgi:general secretion pathway protein M
MQLIPDQQNSKTTAILLLVVSVILVYLLMFHWFILRHREYALELGDLRDQLARFETVAAQREPMEQRLRSIRESREDADLFLSEADFNEAAAAMSDRLGQMVRTQADDDCQIVSRQPVRPRVQERYERVTVNVRMRCQPGDLLQILHRLESEIPMVMVDDLNIIRPRARRRVAGNVVEVAQALDVRFNMSGYLK